MEGSPSIALSNLFMDVDHVWVEFTGDHAVKKELSTADTSSLLSCIKPLLISSFGGNDEAIPTNSLVVSPHDTDEKEGIFSLMQCGGNIPVAKKMCVCFPSNFKSQIQIWLKGDGDQTLARFKMLQPIIINRLLDCRISVDYRTQNLVFPPPVSSDPARATDPVDQGMSGMALARRRKPAQSKATKVKPTQTKQRIVCKDGVSRVLWTKKCERTGQLEKYVMMRKRDDTGMALRRVT